MTFSLLPSSWKRREVRRCSQSVKELFPVASGVLQQGSTPKASAKVHTLQVTAKSFANFLKEKYDFSRKEGKTKK